MADFEFAPCPSCGKKFMLGEEFYRLPEAYACCPYCKTEFRVGVAAQQAGGANPQPASAHENRSSRT